jgi:hypothetical protein
VYQKLDLKVANPALLEEAFKAAGYGVQKLGKRLLLTQNGQGVGVFENGVVTSSVLGEEQINQVRKSYSAVCVKRAAARFGGRVQMTGPNKGKIVMGQ